MVGDIGGKTTQTPQPNICRMHALTLSTPSKDIEGIGLWAVDPAHLKDLCACAMDIGVTCSGLAVQYACALDVALRAGGPRVAVQLDPWMTSWLTTVTLQDVADACIMEALQVGWHELGYLSSSVLAARTYAGDKNYMVTIPQVPCVHCGAPFRHTETLAVHTAAHYRAKAQARRLIASAASAPVSDARRVRRIQQLVHVSGAHDEIGYRPMQTVLKQGGVKATCAVCGDDIDSMFDEVANEWKWVGTLVSEDGDEMTFTHSECTGKK